MKLIFVIRLSIVLLISTYGLSQNRIERKDIEVYFDKDAQIEVGNHFMGVEFHHSFPTPQRISFFYPVANSIDFSNDYWKRDSTFIMAMGIKEEDKEIEWLGTTPYEIYLTPYSVTFQKTDLAKEIKITYEFCRNKPAMVLTIELKNLLKNRKKFSFYTDLQTSLKTSHTYNSKNEAWTEFNKTTNSLFTNFDDPETQRASIFLLNAGETPVSYSGKSSISNYNRIPNFWWDKDDVSLDNVVIHNSKLSTPAARFLYKKSLGSNEKLKIVQVIGSSTEEEKDELVKYLNLNYEKEVDEYEQYVLEEVNKNLFLTGDSVLDQSILWAKALLAVNQHYIDGSIQPMPCPAEYNFYFTHDVLLTDLAIVNFDLQRVKKDLQFIIKYASEGKIIPHAYYWKDSSFKTELVTIDGWNHFWFIILSASYLEHSGDTTFAKELYPFVKKSIEESFKSEKDGLMYSFRPDWWDIGRNYGPRSYMTILGIKSIRDFIFISKSLGESVNELGKFSELAEKMQRQLNEKLWSNERKYLINFYEDGSEDPHYYMGSLLAVCFDLLNEERSKDLVATAEKFLLDEKLGIYTVSPMDFHQLIDFFKFAGNETGEPFKYVNGGIWPHANAWYALALIKTGEKERAIEFIKRTMTLNGIINSPNGQPAMYEYRNSNFNNPNEYGKIDKPQFMWAAGWYLYVLYEYFNK